MPPHKSQSTTSTNFDPHQQGFVKVTGSNGLPDYYQFNSPIITSANDKQEYRIIRLSNHLQAVVIHDPKADKASAALSVNVGHLSDPKDLPGLAHFCEHLLFMGNVKVYGLPHHFNNDYQTGFLTAFYDFVVSVDFIAVPERERVF